MGFRKICARGESYQVGVFWFIRRGVCSKCQSGRCGLETVRVLGAGVRAGGGNTARRVQLGVEGRRKVMWINRCVMQCSGGSSELVSIVRVWTDMR